MSFTIKPGKIMFEQKEILHPNHSLNFLIFEKDKALAPIVLDDGLLNKLDSTLSQTNKIKYSESTSRYNSNIILIPTESEITKKLDITKTLFSTSFHEFIHYESKPHS